MVHSLDFFKWFQMATGNVIDLADAALVLLIGQEIGTHPDPDGLDRKR